MEGGTRTIFVTSPGKVILFGEHAVVYGKPALAASVDLCTFVHVKNSRDKNVHLKLINLNWKSQWTIDQITESLQGFMCKDLHSAAVLSVEDIECLRLVSKISSGLESPAVLVFMYLYSSIMGSNGNKLLPLDVAIVSSIPIGAGLGSSGSYTTSLTAAMLRAVNAINEEDLSVDELNLINRWAFSAEHILHGKPSGVDNAVSVFGGLIYFKGATITPIKNSVILEIVLIDTKVKRETKTLVDKVRKRSTEFPAIIQKILDAIGVVTDKSKKILTDLDKRDIKFDELVTLVEMNQGLLSSLGVSHPKLDEICQIATQHGFRAKLTGAGGGGCAFIFVPPEVQGLEGLMVELEQKGFSLLRIKVGGSGVQLHPNINEFKQNYSEILHQTGLTETISNVLDR